MKSNKLKEGFVLTGSNIYIFQVDAFTKKPFSGNPAAVCITDSKMEEGWMQKVAQEMNLSETAFLWPSNDKSFNLKWFTPTTEVDLCGHATLAAAKILFSQNYLSQSEKNEITFNTNSGKLTANLIDNMIELDFPIEREVALEEYDELIRALRIGYSSIKFVGKNQFDFLVEVESEEKLGEIAPDHNKLAELTERGVIVTSASSLPSYDFVSRFFAPAVGVAEDPVTGSAHCNLGPYWKDRLHKDELIAYQDSDRGGEIKVKVDEQNDRVILGGQAVVVFKGTLLCQ